MVTNDAHQMLPANRGASDLARPLMINDATSVSSTTARDSGKVGLTRSPHVGEELLQLFVGVPQVGLHVVHGVNRAYALLPASSSTETERAPGSSFEKSSLSVVTTSCLFLAHCHKGKAPTGARATTGKAFWPRHAAGSLTADPPSPPEPLKNRRGIEPARPQLLGRQNATAM
jgi:hypothetical protein